MVATTVTASTYRLNTVLTLRSQLALAPTYQCKQALQGFARRCDLMLIELTNSCCLKPNYRHSPLFLLWGYFKGSVAMSLNRCVLIFLESLAGVFQRYSSRACGSAPKAVGTYSVA